nr:Mariner Mos1 transposase [Hymenolepis microstoma]CUU99296.1 Mariner Mos1 transposase [Hymenolepis microstoma]
MRGDFAVEDLHSGGGEKVVEDRELEMLKKNYQNHWVGISEQVISKRLKQLGMIEKEGYWVPHELKPRDVERRRLFACEQLLERHTRKRFLHPIVTGDDSY